MSDKTKTTQVPVNEDQSDKVARHRVGIESSDGKYPDHAVEDVDFGGSGVVPYPVRQAQLAEAREKHGEEAMKKATAGTGDEAAEGRIPENTTDGQGAGVAAARDGYRAFDSGVNPPKAAPAPHLDGTSSVPTDVNKTPTDEDGTGGNAADNSSTRSEDRAAAPKAEGGTADPKKSESAAKKASPKKAKKGE